MEGLLTWKNISMVIPGDKTSPIRDIKVHLGCLMLRKIPKKFKFRLTLSAFKVRVNADILKLRSGVKREDFENQYGAANNALEITRIINKLIKLNEKSKIRRKESETLPRVAVQETKDLGYLLKKLFTKFLIIVVIQSLELQITELEVKICDTEPHIYDTSSSAIMGGRKVLVFKLISILSHFQYLTVRIFTD
jgi:hypothetical protein